MRRVLLIADYAKGIFKEAFPPVPARVSKVPDSDIDPADVPF